MTNLKKILVVAKGLFLSTLISSAHAANQKIETEPQDFTIEAQREQFLFADYIEEFTGLINASQLAQDSDYNLSGIKVADSCIALMTKNQIQGPIGEYISLALRVHAAKLPYLIEGGKLNAICPKYKTMSLVQKSQVWTLILATMAHFESSCQAKATAKGPNGIAYGFYQLHKGKEDLYDKEATLCLKNSASNPKLASKCAMSMLNLQLKVKSGVLFSTTSYWDVLRPNGSSGKAAHIRSAIINSSLCNPKML